MVYWNYYIGKEKKISWIEIFAWKWPKDRNLSKFLHIPFGLDQCCACNRQ